VFPFLAGTKLDSILYWSNRILREIFLKEKSIRIFGNKKNRLCFVLVLTELIPFENEVNSFFFKLGCKQIYSKIKIISNTQNWMHIRKNIPSVPSIVTQTAIYSNNPTKLIVLKFPTNKTLIKRCTLLGIKLDKKALSFLDSNDITKFVSYAIKGHWINPAPNTFRKSIRIPLLEKIGIKTMTGLIANLDVGGHYLRKHKAGFDVKIFFSGLHVPDDTVDCINEAIIFFSRKELNEILAKL
jgi:hypothetical protein